ncbi:hypothetical protein K439DRAFT_1540870 [Ramaria rubella]|nr:hypothetical protein K439DRAFT_1540870 [Ramaria rubella]
MVDFFPHSNLPAVHCNVTIAIALDTSQDPAKIQPSVASVLENIHHKHVIAQMIQTAMNRQLVSISPRNVRSAPVHTQQQVQIAPPEKQYWIAISAISSMQVTFIKHNTTVPTPTILSFSIMCRLHLPSTHHCFHISPFLVHDIKSTSILVPPLFHIDPPHLFTHLRCVLRPGCRASYDPVAVETCPLS